MDRSERRLAGGGSRGRAETARSHTTISGMEVEPVYRPGSVSQWSYERALNDPGEFPYTRGAYRDMYRGRIGDGHYVWQLREIDGSRHIFGLAEGRDSHAFEHRDRAGRIGIAQLDQF